MMIGRFVFLISHCVLSSSSVSSNPVINFLNSFCPQVMTGYIDLMHTGRWNFKCFFFRVNNNDSCSRAMITTTLRGYDVIQGESVRPSVRTSVRPPVRFDSEISVYQRLILKILILKWKPKSSISLISIYWASAMNGNLFL